MNEGDPLQERLEERFMRLGSKLCACENKPDMKRSCSEKMLDEIITDMGKVSVCLMLGEEIEGFEFAKFFFSYANVHGCIMPKAVLTHLRRRKRPRFFSSASSA